MTKRIAKTEALFFVHVLMENFIRFDSDKVLVGGSPCKPPFFFMVTTKVTSTSASCRHKSSTKFGKT